MPVDRLARAEDDVRLGHRDVGEPLAVLGHEELVGDAGRDVDDVAGADLVADAVQDDVAAPLDDEDRGLGALVVVVREVGPRAERDVEDGVAAAGLLPVEDAVPERELVARSDLVACSSDELAARMRERTAPRALVVVRNGWDPQAFPVQPSSPLPRHGPLSLAYFGTVAAWLDFDALHALVRDDNRVSVRLIGPLDGVGADDLAGLVRVPPVEHSRLAQAVAGADALLLPFRVDDLTRAVDPVKLYEYVALGKPILASHWPELDRFAPMLTFYRDATELCELVRKRAFTQPPSQAEREAFLAPQSWGARGNALREAIERVRPAR